MSSFRRNKADNQVRPPSGRRVSRVFPLLLSPKCAAFTATRNDTKIEPGYRIILSFILYLAEIQGHFQADVRLGSGNRGEERNKTTDEKKVVVR